VVTIETGPDDDMGTDADAYIILKSAEGQTDELSLYCMEGKFKQGLKQEFELQDKPMGDITSIVVSREGSKNENVIKFKITPIAEEDVLVRRLVAFLENVKHPYCITALLHHVCEQSRMHLTKEYEIKCQIKITTHYMWEQSDFRFSRNNF